MKLIMESDNMQDYLAGSDIVDFNHPAVVAAAQKLGTGCANEIDYARAAYHFVRDEICHSADMANPQTVTCKASHVLEAGEGICFAKSHLLVALLRFHSLPAGFCYQILIQNKAADLAKLSLHGLVAVYFKDLDKWVRLDARGNKPGVDTSFSLIQEHLAFVADQALGERDIPVIYPQPATTVINALSAYQTFPELWKNLPATIC